VNFWLSHHAEARVPEAFVIADEEGRALAIVPFATVCRGPWEVGVSEDCIGILALACGAECAQAGFYSRRSRRRVFTSVGAARLEASAQGLGPHGSSLPAKVVVPDCRQRIQNVMQVDGPWRVSAR